MRIAEEANLGFAFYVEHVASALGHADRRAPFSLLLHGAYSFGRGQGHRADCGPPRAPSRPGGASIAAPFYRERRSVEALLWQTRTFVRPAIEKSGKITPGSSTTRDSRRRAFIRSASPGSIADNSASKTIVRSRSRCRQPTNTRACRSPFGSTFPKIGQSIRFAGREPACRRTSSSRPNRKLRSVRSAPRASRACRRGYGINATFRTALTRMDLTYVVGIQSSARLWPPGAGRSGRLRHGPGKVDPRR
jgi:hypothetical protein